MHTQEQKLRRRRRRLILRRKCLMVLRRCRCSSPHFPAFQPSLNKKRPRTWVPLVSLLTRTDPKECNFHPIWPDIGWTPKRHLVYTGSRTIQYASIVGYDVNLTEHSLEKVHPSGPREPPKRPFGPTTCTSLGRQYHIFQT